VCLKSALKKKRNGHQIQVEHHFYELSESGELHRIEDQAKAIESPRRKMKVQEELL
jgi:hypothetical protein